LSSKRARPAADLQTEIANLKRRNARLSAQAQRQSKDLQEARQQQSAIAGALNVISQKLVELPMVLEMVVRTAVELCNADHGYLFRLLDGRHHLAASFGVDPEFKSFLINNPFAVTRGTLSGRVAVDGKVVHIEDAASDPEYTWSEAQQRGNLRSGLGVPLMREGEVMGIFALYRSRVARYSDSQIDLVKTFADQAVIAIENARVLNELQASTNDLSESLQQQTATADVLKVISRSTFDLQVVLDTLVKSAMELCDADQAWLSQRHGEVFRLAAIYSHTDDLCARVRDYFTGRDVPPDRGSVTGRAALEARAVHVSDVLADPEYTWSGAQEIGGYRAAVGAPLLHKGVVVGVIFVGKITPQPFMQKQIELVTTFADQAVIAIENTRLLNELRESLQQQTATSDVLKVISRSTFDLQTVLDTLTESAARLCEAEMAAIVRQKGGAHYWATSYGFPTELSEYLKSIPIEPGRGSVVGRVLMEGKTVHVPDGLADPEYTFSGAQKRGGYRTMLSVPLLREGMPLGVVLLMRRTVQPFTDKQIELVSTFADQAVIAIENVRLFESVEARTRELTQSLEDLRTAQDRLVQTEKLASLGQLTAGIAHEIKNPLNFVNNFSAVSAELVEELQEALAGANLDPKLRGQIEELSGLLQNNLEKVVQHGKRADVIVKNMLLHSRAGSGEHRPVDINAVVDESLNLAYHGARAEKQGFNITIERSFDPMAGEIDLYPQEITRVLLNLIANGFYAATKRKTEANGGDYEPVLLAATKNLGDKVEIRIRDNGTGIPSEIKEKMFNPFFTTKPAGEGTGLGLSISHDIILKQHAGRIEVETQPGEFTEFRIILPRTAALLAQGGGTHESSHSGGR